MKRPHRRAHVLIWVLAAPVTAIAAVLFWSLRPYEAVSDLPPGIEATSETDVR